jgi:hypothetical protein
MPSEMVAVFVRDHDEYDLEKPVPVVDFSLGGVSIKVRQKPREGEAGFLTLFLDRHEVHRVPAMVVNISTEGEFYRIGLKLNTQASCYRMQKAILEKMEFKCIERGHF